MCSRVVDLTRNERGDGVDPRLASLDLDATKAGIGEEGLDALDGEAPEVERQLVLAPHEGDGDDGGAAGLEHPEELARELRRAARVLEHLRAQHGIERCVAVGDRPAVEELVDVLQLCGAATVLDVDPRVLPAREETLVRSVPQPTSRTAPGAADRANRATQRPMSVSR